MLSRKWLRDRLPLRILRHRDDNAVWFWQQNRVRRAIERAFEAAAPLELHGRLDLHGGWPDSDDPRPVLLAACDEAYFDQFAQYLALSSVARSALTRVHLHVYEPSPGCVERGGALAARCGGRLTISHEPPGRNAFGRPIRFYYAAARFAVASRLRQAIRAPILMVDADSLVVKDLAPGFERLAGDEAGFIRQFDSAAPYRQILASAIYLGAGSARAIEFFTRLADGIGLAMARAGPYHVDQIGIHYALSWWAGHGRSLRIHGLDMRWSDSAFGPDALIWSTRGPRKSQFERLLASFEDLRPVEPVASEM